MREKHKAPLKLALQQFRNRRFHSKKGRKEEWKPTLVLAREWRPQKRAGEAHEFQSESKLLLILSCIGELECGPDLAHSGRELPQENWNKSPKK